jgi:hypothetical protein
MMASQLSPASAASRIRGERNDSLTIHCARLGARVLPATALEEVLDNDVKNMDQVCGCCRNPCHF